MVFFLQACCNPAVAACVLTTEGWEFGVDAASANEILLARGRLGRRPDQVLFSGNNLSHHDIQVALEQVVVLVDESTLFSVSYSVCRPGIFANSFHCICVDIHMFTLTCMCLRGVGGRMRQSR